MLKMRIQFVKQESVRFISHLDLMSTISRAIRRAKVPIAFSQGFNPHHLISMGPALKVGITSNAEYMDIEFAEKISVSEFMEKMKPQMPKGLELVKAEIISPQVKSLTAQINIAVYMIRLKTNLEKEGIQEAIREIYKQDKILIKRQSKKKIRELDIKPLLRDLKLIEMADDFILQLTSQTGSNGNLRPDEVVVALAEYEGIEIVPYTWMHRKGLYIEEKGRLLTPFEAAKI
ncbi:MAG: TIGR03936 family radical SAM-associated protein [Halanaerobiales bacterium]|nr:TIGR03936 family radical SAM-associated protein [Halanaerobiales bacterium]